MNPKSDRAALVLALAMILDEALFMDEADAFELRLSVVRKTDSEHPGSVEIDNYEVHSEPYEGEWHMSTEGVYHERKQFLYNRFYYDLNIDEATNDRIVETCRILNELSDHRPITHSDLLGMLVEQLSGRAQTGALTSLRDKLFSAPLFEKFTKEQLQDYINETERLEGLEVWGTFKSARELFEDVVMYYMLQDPATGSDNG